MDKKDERIKELEEMVHRQGEVITMLENQLEKLEKFIDEKIFQEQ